MKLKVKVDWTCRHGGGLFLGVNYHFPVTLGDEDALCGTLHGVSLGFIFFRVRISITTKHRRHFSA